MNEQDEPKQEWHAPQLTYFPLSKTLLDCWSGHDEILDMEGE